MLVSGRVELITITLMNSSRVFLTVGKPSILLILSCLWRLFSIHLHYPLLFQCLGRTQCIPSMDEWNDGFIQTHRCWCRKGSSLCWMVASSEQTYSLGALCSWYQLGTHQHPLLWKVVGDDSNEIWCLRTWCVLSRPRWFYKSVFGGRWQYWFNFLDGRSRSLAIVLLFVRECKRSFARKMFHLQHIHQVCKLRTSYFKHIGWNYETSAVALVPGNGSCRMLVGPMVLIRALPLAIYSRRFVNQVASHALQRAKLNSYSFRTNFFVRCRLKGICGYLRWSLFWSCEDKYALSHCVFLFFPQDKCKLRCV